jgi:hypothetical protein
MSGSIVQNVGSDMGNQSDRNGRDVCKQNSGDNFLDLELEDCFCHAAGIPVLSKTMKNGNLDSIFLTSFRELLCGLELERERRTCKA